MHLICGYTSRSVFQECSYGVFHMHQIHDKERQRKYLNVILYIKNGYVGKYISFSSKKQENHYHYVYNNNKNIVENE